MGDKLVAAAVWVSIIGLLHQGQKKKKDTAVNQT